MDALPRSWSPRDGSRQQFSRCREVETSNFRDPSRVLGVRREINFLQSRRTLSNGLFFGAEQRGLSSSDVWANSGLPCRSVSWPVRVKNTNRVCDLACWRLKFRGSSEQRTMRSVEVSPAAAAGCGLLHNRGSLMRGKERGGGPAKIGARLGIPNPQPTKSVNPPVGESACNFQVPTPTCLQLAPHHDLQFHKANAFEMADT
jgi:hypothetical protein